jgi:arabinofuranosyltransferase
VPSPHSEQTAARLPRLIASLLTLVFLVVLVRTAWISDDALITLRTVLNVTNGFGLTFNIAERVQTFTHPLWLGLLTLVYVFTRNIYYGTFMLSMACSAAAFWLAIRNASTPMQSLLVAIVLLWSRAFVDFSTSGLENPLSYVLLALFAGLFVDEQREPRTRLTGLWLLAALLYLTRPDEVLLVLPMLIVACWRVKRIGTIAVSALVGLLPAVAWTVFAVVYYGFPFPNTAYAKLATGISGAELRSQGSLYLLDSIDRDPLTMTTIAFAILLALVARPQRRDAADSVDGASARGADTHVLTAARALSAGLLLYLVYVVSVGGDFMAGRFVAVPLFGAALVVGWFIKGPRTLWAGAAAILVVVGSTSMHVPLWSNSRFDDSAQKPTGIVDERGVYFKDKSLVRAKRATFRNPNWPSAEWEAPPLRVFDTCGLMGSAAIELGPYAHLLDDCALADPLLARLPAVYNPQWRTGHYRRMVPEGYRESLEASENRIQDLQLRKYYDQLLAITRSGDLFSSARLGSIYRMNLGAYDHLIDRSFYRHAGARVQLGALAVFRQDGAPWNAEGHRILKTPLAVVCDDKPGRRYLDVSLDSDDLYELTFLKKGEIVGTAGFGPVPEYRRSPGLASYLADVPPGARSRGFDTIVVTPIQGNNQYAIGHLLLDGFDATDALLRQRVAQRDGRAPR